MDPVLEQFRKIVWRYAERDQQALIALEQRIAIAGRKRSLVTYSELVRGISFNLPNLSEPVWTIDVADWRELDRAMVGDFLGYISMRSYEYGRFFSSSLVVSKLDGTPGDGFYNLLKGLGLISRMKSKKALEIWAEHVAKSHTWFSKH